MQTRLFPVLLFSSWVGCVATPLPQPPVEIELDPSKVEAEASGEGVAITGSEDAIDPGGIEIRVTPLPDPDIDPILEPGTATVGDDGSFTVFVISPLENTYLFEATGGDEDVFFGAIQVDAAGNVTEGDPGPDGDDDGSPDAIDCAPDDPELKGQRCP